MKKGISSVMTLHFYGISLLTIMKRFGIIEISAGLVILIPFLAILMTIAIDIVIVIIGRVIEG